MKIYEVALFMLIFNAAGNVVNEMHLDSTQLDYRSGISDELQKEAPQSGDSVSNIELNTIASTFGMIIAGIVFLLKIISYSTFLFPVELNNVGISPISALGVMLWTVYWTILIIGYLQYSSRSSFGGTE